MIGAASARAKRARQRGQGRGTAMAAILLRLLVFLVALSLSGMAARAACLPVAGLEPRVIPAAAPAEGSVRLAFLGHASFLIESPGGVTAVTDYNGMLGPRVAPDIVTMNHAHPSHYTDRIDPAIGHVLRGWDPGGGMAVHDLTVKDMHVWNVPTNERDAAGGRTANDNSIFVFEAAGLCIAHLGHLHHTLTETHLADLGVIDVLLVPVDGAYTLGQDLMVQVIDQIHPAVVIPMHYFN